MQKKTLHVAEPCQIFHILEYRRGEMTLTANVAIRNDGHQIKQLTQQTVTAGDLMTSLTGEMRNDSKFIKILTFLALLYTPASLAAVRRLRSGTLKNS